MCERRAVSLARPTNRRHKLAGTVRFGISPLGNEIRLCGAERKGTVDRQRVAAAAVGSACTVCTS